ncbi:MAG: 3-hydroxyacyl-ACP dehydratase FabZ family protein [Methylophilaceae bacterium]
MKQQTILNIPVDHPAFAGHFPGTPIVPGVVLLDAAIQAIVSATGEPLNTWQISAVKFLSPLKPGEAVIIEHEVQANGGVRFDVLAGARHIVAGSLIINATTPNIAP